MAAERDVFAARLVAVALVGAAAVHAAYLLLPGVWEHFDTDDPFFYFEIARNLAEHGRLSFDGVELTNGVQPLWALVLGGVAWLLPDAIVHDSWRLMLAFRFVASAVNLAAGYLLFRLGSSIAGRVAGVLAMLAWTLSPYVFRRDLLGFESGLYAVMLVSTLLAYRRWDQRPSDGRSVALGVLLGLTVLARLNAVFLAPVLGLAALRPWSANWRLRELLFIAAATAAVVTPYLVFNLVVFGHLTPIAGAVKQLDDAQVLASRFGDGWSPGLAAYVVSAFAGTVWQLLLLVAKAYLALGVMGGSLIAFRWHLAPEPWILLEAAWALAMVGGAAILAVSVWRSRASLFAARPCRDRHVDLRGCGILGVYVLADLLISSVLYPTYVATSGYWWWFTNAVVAGVLLVACAAAAISRRLPPTTVSAALASVLVMALANASLWTGYRIFVTTTGLTPRTHLMANYQITQWMNANLPRDAVVGAGNAAVAGFFYEGRVIDLAGVANNFEYLAYLRRGQVGEYVAATGMTHVLQRGTIQGWEVPIRRVLHENEFPLPQPGVVGVYELDRSALVGARSGAR